MRAKEYELLKRLTEDEQSSLKSLCHCGSDRGIPTAHAQKFLTLGLAELNCGGLGPTGTGRNAAALQTRH